MRGRPTRTGILAGDSTARQETMRQIFGCVRAKGSMSKQCISSIYASPTTQSTLNRSENSQQFRGGLIFPRVANGLQTRWAHRPEARVPPKHKTVSLCPQRNRSRRRKRLCVVRPQTGVWKQEGEKQKMPVRLATNGHLNCKTAGSYWPTMVAPRKLST